MVTVGLYFAVKRPSRVLAYDLGDYIVLHNLWRAQTEEIVTADLPPLRPKRHLSIMSCASWVERRQVEKNVAGYLNT